MQIDGYRAYGDHHEADELFMFLADDVWEFLKVEAAGANRQHVRKIRATLENIRRNGLQGMSNNTLFVREGKFPAGQPGMADMAVYAAKAFQVRVYGGIIRMKAQSVFLWPESVIKKDQKADRTQLERVAKVLGYHNER